MKALIVLLFLALAGCADADPKSNNANNANNANNINNANNANNANNSNNANNGDIRACTGNDQCMLAFNTCCGTCAEPQASDFDAINASFFEQHRQSVCPEEQPCPACEAQPNPYLKAGCNEGTCEVVNVENTALVGCEADAECVARSTECCECGNDTFGQVIGLNRNRIGDFIDLVCTGAEQCAECAPDYSIYTMQCVEGKCEALVPR